MKIHAEYGGVVPEIASRDHVRKLLPMVERCLADAGVERDSLDGVAYTAGPGLIGALLVGLSYAKGLSLATGLPYVGVDHILAHVYACEMADPDLSHPFLALVVSGGHTSLFQATGPGEVELLGESLDDAAGEAFDKVASLLGLPYPGGPHLEKFARSGDATKVELNRFRATKLRARAEAERSGVGTLFVQLHEARLASQVFGGASEVHVRVGGWVSWRTTCSSRSQQNSKNCAAVAAARLSGVARAAM